jgi:hypothetical protein
MRKNTALKNYQKKWDSKHNIFSDTPLHNWACLTGETKIRTLSGWKEIKDLVDKDFIIWLKNLISKIHLNQEH